MKLLWTWLLIWNKFDKFGAKIKSDIKYPYQFDLNDYIKGSNGRSFKNNSGKEYELYAVINHEGKYSHWGHYNSYVKGFDQNWYSCDDSKVKKLTDINQKCSEKAYILFYRLKSSDSQFYSPLRRISNVSTEMAHNEEWKTKKMSKPKTLSKFNRKRKRGSRIEKPSEKFMNLDKNSLEKGEIQVVSRAMSEVSDWTSTSSKRFKVIEDDEFDITCEISIEI